MHTSKTIIVAGIGTDVGKTIASAVLVTALKADYWKPVQCGDIDASDSKTVRLLVKNDSHKIYPSAYTLKAPVSPHYAARLENKLIDVNKICLPMTDRILIVESCGGILVPLTNTILTIDLFCQWDAEWIIVSRDYIGSINHTLLTIEALKMRNAKIKGLIFNGNLNSESEKMILEFSKLKLLGKLLPENHLNMHIIKRYAKEWKKTL